MNVLIVIFLPLILSQVLSENSTNKVLQEEIDELKNENALILSQVLGQNSTNEVLHEEIDELKNENADLKIQVDALENRINEVHPTCPIKKSSVFSIEGRVSESMSCEQ